MAITYKTSNTKPELLKIAAENGVAVDGEMKKPQIIAALDAHNAAQGAETPAATDNTTEDENAAQSGTDGAGSDTDGGDGEKATEGAQNGAEGAETPAATDDTTEDENAAQSGTDGAGSDDPDEYNMFVYAGPTLPRGQLKENAVFRGTFADVTKYLADVLEQYPQAAKLIVPTHKLGAFSVKVKTPGNIANKYYNDIVSTMRNHKEV